MSTYAKQSGKLPQLDFVGTVLTSSPISVESFARGRNPPRSGGDRVRLLEVEVPEGNAGGIWRDADLKDIDYKNTAELSNRLVAMSKKYYGTAGREWIDFLVSNRSDIPKLLNKYTSKFVDSLGHLDSIQGRIANKIGLIYAAGRLARKTDILKWTKPRILEIAQKMYRAVIKAGFEPPPSEADAFAALRRALSDQVRFPVIVGRPVAALLPAEGFVRSDEDEVLITTEALKAVISAAGATTDKGATSISGKLFDPTILKSGAKGRRTNEVRVGGEKKRYHIFHRTRLMELLTSLAKNAAPLPSKSEPVRP